MAIALYFIIIVITLALLYFVAPFAVGAYLRYRGKRVITCPETHKPAAVEVDARHAALTAAVTYPDLRLKSCTRWPERDDCGQACLLQVKLSPEDCLVRNILTTWYDGKHCVSCGTQFGVIRWLDHKPALLGPDGNTVQWSEVAAEKVPEVLTTHFPVCWDCYTTESFCREHPEMIVDRSTLGAGIHRHPSP
ncbi:MAG: hypothetical protein WAV20_14645 [Blastocatellia bacterium]